MQRTHLIAIVRHLGHLSHLAVQHKCGSRMSQGRFRGQEIGDSMQILWCGKGVGRAQKIKCRGMRTLGRPKQSKRVESETGDISPFRKYLHVASRTPCLMLSASHSMTLFSYTSLLISLEAIAIRFVLVFWNKSISSL